MLGSIRTLLVAILAAALLATGLTPAKSMAADPILPGAFVALAPTRILDTRSGSGRPARSRRALRSRCR